MKFTISRAEDYMTARRRLLLIICPSLKCFHCGKVGDETTLEFDHLHLKSYVTARLNSKQRLRTYFREWLAAGASEGSGLVGACGKCNSARGGGMSAGGVANRSVYAKTPHRRRRRRRGRGYSTAGYIAGQAEYYRQQLERERERDVVPF